MVKLNIGLTSCEFVSYICGMSVALCISCTKVKKTGVGYLLCEQNYFCLWNGFILSTEKCIEPIAHKMKSTTVISLEDMNYLFGFLCSFHVKGDQLGYSYNTGTVITCLKVQFVGFRGIY